MRAVIQDRLGGPEVLYLGEVPVPVPGIGEVLIRVSAAGVNPADTMHRANGAFGTPPPFVLGWDVSGTVAAVGPGVTIWGIGDEVFGMLPFPRGAGAYAEFAVGPARAFARKPSALSHPEAAALPLAGLTAWQALVDTAHVSEGDRVLVTGGSGGVGHLAVQIAVGLGATVVAVASAERHDFVRGLGAEAVVDRSLTGAGAVMGDADAALEVVGRDYPARVLPFIRGGGVLVSTLPQSLDPVATTARDAGVRAVGLFVEADQIGMNALARLAEEHRLRPTIAAAYPLADAAAAHTGPHGPGKVVLVVG